MSVILNNGYEFRIKKANDLNVNIYNQEKRFFKYSEVKEPFIQKCKKNVESEKIDLYLFGDSHAYMYTDAILDYSKKYKKILCHYF